MKYEELDFTNDFLFCKILTTNLEITKELLEIIMDIKIKSIKNAEAQKTVEITKDARGVRFDVYAEDDDSVYDIEMQTTEQKDLPKRSRYYQGMIDLNLFQRGERFRELRKSYVIFICKNDPFGRKLPRYTFRNRCEEASDLLLGDETVKVFINTDSLLETVSPRMQDFIHYLRREPIVNNTAFIDMLDKEVQKARANEAWKLEYMSLLAHDEDKIEEGRAIGIEEGRQITTAENFKTITASLMRKNPALSKEEAEAEAKDLLQTI